MQEIYRLVKHVNFSAEYIESISPADRSLFIMYHDKELEEERKQREKQSAEPGYTPGPTIGRPIEP